MTDCADRLIFSYGHGISNSYYGRTKPEIYKELIFMLKTFRKIWYNVMFDLIILACILIITAAMLLIYCEGFDMLRTCIGLTFIICTIEIMKRLIHVSLDFDEDEGDSDDEG